MVLSRHRSYDEVVVIVFVQLPYAGRAGSFLPLNE